MAPADKLLPQRVYLPVVLEKKVNRPPQRCGGCGQTGHNARGCSTIKYEQPQKTKKEPSIILPSAASWEFELFLAAKEFFDWDITKGE